MTDSLPHRPSRRRALLTLAASLAGACVAWLRRAAAGERPAEAFRADGFDEAMRALFGTQPPRPSEAVRIGVARLAENGAVVPVKVQADLDGVRAITLLATKNPVPLIARFELGERLEPFIATRVKLAETSEVVAVVETASGTYLARKKVEVTIGGCGG